MRALAIAFIVSVAVLVLSTEGFRINRAIEHESRWIPAVLVESQAETTEQTRVKASCHDYHTCRDCILNEGTSMLVMTHACVWDPLKLDCREDKGTPEQHRLWIGTNEAYQFRQCPPEGERYPPEHPMKIQEENLMRAQRELDAVRARIRQLDEEEQSLLRQSELQDSLSATQDRSSLRPHADPSAVNKGLKYSAIDM